MEYGTTMAFANASSGSSVNHSDNVYDEQNKK